MTEQKKAPKRKAIDWNKKSDDDKSRISKRIERRSELKDNATTNNDSRPPRAIGLPLLRLRNKIKEVYDTEDDENEDTPFFNINLIEDEPTAPLLSKRKADETVTITKQQQLTGKLNLIMDTTLIADEIGLSPKMTAKDAKRAASAEYDLKKLRRQTVKEKIEDPLGLEGEIAEKDLKKAAKGLKNAKQKLPDGALEGFPAKDAEELIELDKEDMAKLILKKSGRRKSKKKLSELAKDLNQFKNFEEPETNNKE